MSFMKGDLLAKTRRLVKALPRPSLFGSKPWNRICGFEPVPARIFCLRVLELKEHGVSEEEAMAVADMEYRAEKTAKKKAYARLKQIARLQGKRPPPNPYPSAIKEIQAEERKYYSKWCKC